jgi:hypothetical protein
MYTLELYIIISYCQGQRRSSAGAFFCDPLKEHVIQNYLADHGN